MAHPTYITKTLFMKPEVTRIFDDLEKWLDYCRFNLLPFNEADLYRSRDWKDSQRGSGEQRERKPYLGSKPRSEYRPRSN